MKVCVPCTFSKIRNLQVHNDSQKILQRIGTIPLLYFNKIIDVETRYIVL